MKKIQRTWQKIQRTILFRADELELLLWLPTASFINPHTTLRLLLAIADVLGCDGGWGPDEMKHGLQQSMLMPNISDPIRTIRNIRRWALDGLRDESVLSNLSHLQSPDVEETTEVTSLHYCQAGLLHSRKCIPWQLY